jgi:hypothetical protein
MGNAQKAINTGATASVYLRRREHGPDVRLTDTNIAGAAKPRYAAICLRVRA